WRRAVPVLTLPGRHTNESELRDVTADRRLGHLDPALRQLLGDLGLRGDERLLDQVGYQPLTVLFARHIYAVYTDCISDRQVVVLVVIERSRRVRGGSLDPDRLGCTPELVGRGEVVAPHHVGRQFEFLHRQRNGVLVAG